MKPHKNNHDIFGKAIKDFYLNGKAEDIIVHSPDFDDDVIPVDYLFREYPEMPLWNSKPSNRVLEECWI